MSWSHQGFSQQSDLGYLEIEVDKDAGIIKTVFDFNPLSLGNPSAVFHETLGKNFWRAGHYKCHWGNIKTRVISVDRNKVSAESYCSQIQSDLSLHLDFLSKMATNYTIIGRVISDGVESTFIADKIHREILVSKNEKKSFFDFLKNFKF